MDNNNPKLNRPLFDLIFFILTVIGICILIVAYYRFRTLFVLFSVLGVILYIGFGLPRWVGRSIAMKRASAAKIKEFKKWGFSSRDREGPWINYIDYPLIRSSKYVNDKRFYSEWLIIHDGIIVINPGPSTVNLDAKIVSYDFAAKRTYAWDGCTPKQWFFWFALIGTPDWGKKLLTVCTLNNEQRPVQIEVFWQKAHHASLIHDALYQYLDTIPVAKRDVDRLFCEMLKESGMSGFMALVYRVAVRLFGGRGVKNNDPKENSALILERFITLTDDIQNVKSNNLVAESGR